MNLPFRDESFDIGLLVAMLTVVPDAREREVIAAELARVLRPGGRMLIAEFGVTEKPNYLARYFETDPAREGGTLDVVGDDGTMLYRAHHFTEAELEVLVSNAGLVVREIVRQDFVSYTGNAVRGFVVSARREK